jgi:hypothetical protein
VAIGQVFAAAIFRDHSKFTITSRSLFLMRDDLGSLDQFEGPVVRILLRCADVEQEGRLATSSNWLLYTIF